MTTFDNREQAFESKYAHDQEFEFKSIARRNKLIGHWAAEKLGLTGEAAEEYARAVVRSDFEEPGDEDVFRKLRADLNAAASPVADVDIRMAMVSMLDVARQQLRDGD